MKIFSKKTIGIALLLLVPLLTAVLAGYWLLQYYLPACWMQTIEDDFLVKNQHFLRSDSLRRQSFGKFLLHNLQLGTSGKELLTAPSAELKLNQKLWSNPKHLAFESLQLFDSPVTITADTNGISVNGHPLRNFAEALTQLPSAPDGRSVALQVNAKLKLGNAPEVRDATFFITLAPPEKLNIKISWQGGSGEVWIDLTNDILNASFGGSLNMALWQEILLRSGLSAPVVRLLKKAELYGNGKFSANLKNQTITNLAGRLKVSGGEIDWYGHRINQSGAVEIEINRNLSGFILNIPQMSINSPAPAEFKNTVLQYRFQTSKLQIQTHADLRQLLMGIFCRHFNIPTVSSNSHFSQLSGSWDTRTGQWNIQARKADAAVGDIAVDSSDNIRLAMTARDGDFQAAGNGKTGRMTHDFDFTKLELHTPQGISRVDRGKVYAAINFGTGNNTTENTLEFNFINLAADYEKIQFEIPVFAGELNLRTRKDNSREVYLITRGTKSRAMGKNYKLDLDNFQGTLNMEQTSAQTAWKITDFNFTAPAGQAEFAEKNIAFKNAFFRGSSSLSEKELNTAAVYFSCAELASGQFKLQQPVLNVDYSKQRPVLEQYRIALTVQDAVLPENPWHIRTVQNGKLDCSTSGKLTIPTEFKLQSDALQYKSSIVSADLYKSSIEVTKKSADEFSCLAEFASLKANTGENRYGQGSFGHGKIKIQWQPATAGFPKKFSASLTASPSDWCYRSANINGESSTADFEYNTEKTPAVNGHLTVDRPTLLSSYFNAVGNKLTAGFSGSADKLSGTINYSGSSLGTPDGNIELKDTVLTLPINIAGQLPGKLPDGTISARQLFYKQQPEGSFSGRVTHSLNTITTEHFLQLDGTLSAAKFNNRPFNIRTRWQLPPGVSSTEWEFALPESDLVHPLNLSRCLDLPCNMTALKGKFALNGKLSRQDRKPPQGSIKLVSTNSDWQLNDLTAEGVISSAQMDIYDNKNVILPHSISAAKLIWKNFILEENELNIICNAPGVLQIANWQGKFAGGTFNLSQTILLDALLKNSAGGLTVQPATFEVHNIPAEKFFRTIGLKYLSGNMPLSGQLRPGLQDGKLVFARSSLNSRTPGGSLLNLTLPDKNMLRVRNKAYQAFAMAALKAMKTTQTQFDFTAEPSEIAMQVKAEGTPAEPIPFVYTGGNPPFRPAEPGEEGFDGEIELNINLKLRPEQPGS